MSEWGFQVHKISACNNTLKRVMAWAEVSEVLVLGHQHCIIVKLTQKQVWPMPTQSCTVCTITQQAIWRLCVLGQWPSKWLAHFFFPQWVQPLSACRPCVFTCWVDLMTMALVRKMGTVPKTHSHSCLIACLSFHQKKGVMATLRCYVNTDCRIIFAA